MFLTCRFRGLRAANSSPLCDPERQPRTSSSYAAARSLQAFVHFLQGQVFPPLVSGIFDSPHFHEGQLTPCHCLLHPQDLRMEMFHSSHSASGGDRFRRCGISWSTRKTPLRLSLSPPHLEFLPTKQGDARQASRSKTKSTVGSSHILPSRCLRRRPRLAVQLVCCT